MSDAWLLVVFMPGRRGLGALGPALEKHHAQYVEGCEEPSVQKRYAARRGLLLSLAGWAPVARQSKSRGADRVVLPEALQGVLDQVAGAVDAFEVTVLRPADRLRYHAEVTRERLRGDLAVGCCYEVYG